MAERPGQVTVEDAQIIFRNFTGKEGPYNREGERGFGVILDPEVADPLANDGWNVKILKAREEGDEERLWLPVAVSYLNRPPRIVMIAGGVRTNLNEETVEMLDYADFRTADLVLNPYTWSVQGKGGIKAYLKTMFVTIDEDPIERKYGSASQD